MLSLAVLQTEPVINPRHTTTIVTESGYQLHAGDAGRWFVPLRAALNAAIPRVISTHPLANVNTSIRQISDIHYGVIAITCPGSVGLQYLRYWYDIMHIIGSSTSSLQAFS